MAFIFNGGDMRIIDNTALHELCVRLRGANPRLFFIADQWHQPKSPHAREFLYAAIKNNGIPCRIIARISELPTTVRQIYMNRAVYDFDGGNHPYASWCKKNDVELFLFDDWSCLREPPRSIPYKVFTPFLNAITNSKGHVVDTLRRRSTTASISTVGYRETATDASRTRAFTLIRAANREYDHDIGSDISPFLSRGVISIREIISKAKDREFIRQILWREFYYQIAYHDPLAMAIPQSASYQLSALKQGRLSDWKHGRTNVEYINLAMRELRNTGRMPNRLRMLVAEKLTSSHYDGVPWWFGEDHFAAWLEDHDVILNRANWLWVADSHRPWSKPEFRGFNLDRQAKNRAVVAFVESFDRP